MKCAAYPGLAVKLKVQGEDLQEYDDDDFDKDGAENDNTTVKYVEVVAGTHFTVELHVQRNFVHKYDDLRMGVLLDGKLLTGFIYKSEPQTHYMKKTVRGLERKTKTGWQMEKLTFADLTTNDGQAQPNLKEKLKNIGEVTVELNRVRYMGVDDTVARDFAPTVGDAGIPEKALKGRALSKRATLSNPEPCVPANFVKIDWPHGRKPFATFTFKYRSRRDLQIEGVIPRSPSPVPLEERDRTTLNEEEMRELIRIQDERLQDRVKVKKERREREDDDGAEEDDGEVTIVEERRKRPRMSTGSGFEVIDLSNEVDKDDD